MVKNWRSEFDPHRHLRREASVRQYNGAGMFCPQFYLRAEHAVLIYNAQINWRTEILCASKRCGPNQKKSRKLAKTFIFYCIFTHRTKYEKRTEQFAPHHLTAK